VLNSFFSSASAGNLPRGSILVSGVGGNLPRGSILISGVGGNLPRESILVSGAGGNLPRGAVLVSGAGGKPPRGGVPISPIWIDNPAECARLYLLNMLSWREGYFFQLQRLNISPKPPNVLPKKIQGKWAWYLVPVIT